MIRRVCFIGIPVLAAAVAFAQTPQPQRTILENRVTKGKDGDKTQQPAGTPESAIDSLLNSTEDLNSIRDGYLRRLAGDGCRPDVAIRVAELRSRLDQTDPARARNAAPQQTDFELDGELMLLAARWYDARPEVAVQRTNRDAARAQLLEEVLAPRGATANAPSGSDRAQLKAELDRLLATCHAAAQ